MALRATRAGEYAALARLILRHSPGLRRGPGAPERPGELEEDAARLPSDLEALGPTFVKLGQLLSTRSDLLPEAHLRALSRLQDDVEPYPGEEAQRIFAEEVGLSTDDVFARFDPTPLAAGSLGQVHRARLRSGREVVVKIQRPAAEERVSEDLAALSELSRFIDAHTEIGRRYGFEDLLHEFGQALSDELDYRREAANLERLSGVLAGHRVVVPRPVADLTTRRVITMDHVPGRKVTDLSGVGLADLDGRALAEELVAAYLDQIFVSGFFHADPHPGNVLVTPDGRLGLIDAGMVGYVRPELRAQLIKLLLAAQAGRGEEAARVLADVGRRLEDFDSELLMREVSAVVGRNLGVSVAPARAGELVADLSRACGECGLRPPPELSMLVRALLSLDAVAEVLAPRFDPTAFVQEHATRLAGAQLRAAGPSLVGAVVEAKEFAEALPGRLGRLMDELVEGRLTLKVNAFDETEFLRGIQKVANRVATGLVLAALVLGAAIISRAYPSVALACFLAATVGGLVLILSIVAGDRHVNRRARRRRKA